MPLSPDLAPESSLPKGVSEGVVVFTNPPIPF